MSSFCSTDGFYSFPVVAVLSANVRCLSFFTEKVGSRSKEKATGQKEKDIRV